MSSSNISALMLPPECSEEKHMANANTDLHQPYLHPMRSASRGPVAVLWDIENCPVPSDVRPEDVASNIRMALRVHPVIDGVVTTFSAYGDFNAFPRRLREGCQRTGVKLIDVPNGRKDAADKAILVDMFLFALDYRPPSSILLISGDVDFAPALHVLGQRGYAIILVIPSRVSVSSALSNAGQFVWDWPSMARGEGFVPPAKVLLPTYGVPTNITGCQINDNLDYQNEEEAIVYSGISKGCCNKRDFSLISKSPSEHNSSSISMPYYSTSSRSHGLSSGLNEVSARPFSSRDQNDLMWVQPGDLNGLKGQLIKLLELSGGCLPLIHLSAEYQKIYERPLYVSEYGALKLASILEKMGDAMAIEGRGKRKFVYLRNARTLILAKRDKRGKEAQDPNDVIAGAGSSEEPSDDERVVIKEYDVNSGIKKSNLEMAPQSEIFDESLNLFKYELQEILVSYYCRISLGCFEAIYQQKYKRSIDYQSFGVNDLEELLDKVRDIVVLQEEPVSKRKFLVAVCG
ncbi:Endonuclease or glycosyl hydrolase [Olea europaea subsp. europaea]|uniref:Endonuclease or glycosyl hydrolase n=1 Tax=Olea europaea subsp. europaea TaxID=158383 RepID=A0A8S0PYE7_OLEEU|nr:Endonuclease or glycosyl hydrolase [Olea europaea subsp. europaea]